MYDSNLIWIWVLECIQLGSLLKGSLGYLLTILSIVKLKTRWVTNYFGLVLFVFVFLKNIQPSSFIYVFSILSIVFQVQN